MTMKLATLNACARAAHEANRAYCIAIGDDSQLPWDEAPEWQRDSAINGVKARTGWKYGPVKDPEKKEHPCFVPYDELPSTEKAKDAIFVSIARTIATALGAA